MNNQATAKTRDADAEKAARCETGQHVRSKFASGGKAPRILSAIGLAALMAANAGAAALRDGTEYDIAAPLGESMQGDQAHADLAIGSNGGYLVWDDNVGDGDGLSVNLRRINSSLSGELNVIPLATKTADHQERPRVTRLAQGGAAFAWQSGPDGKQQIYTRVITANHTFTGPEVAVSSRGDLHQKTPAIAGLTGGNYVVVWASFGQDGSMLGVYGTVFSAAGQKLGNEFKINEYSQFNQRNPAIAALPSGGFVVTWISEGNRGESSVDVMARIFSNSAAPVGNEFRVNSDAKVCSSPAVAVTSAGNFTVTWCEAAQDLNFQTDNGDEGVRIVPLNNREGWDIYAAAFTSGGGRLTDSQRVNQHSQGNQRNPSIAAIGRSQMVVWSSFGQDGDFEGVVGRALNGIGTPDGEEVIVNTTKIGRQILPVVRGNDSRFVAVWSTFTGLASQVDLRAQRFLPDENTIELPPPGAPFVSPLSVSRLSVTWPAADGYDVQTYELYVNGSTTPIAVTGQAYVFSGLAPGTTYRFQVAYRLRDGQLSPRSAETAGTTWGEDWNDDGIPDNWQAQYWGANVGAYPLPNADTDGDGVSNRQEYMAGTSPVDATSVLRTGFVTTPQGPRLIWNTVPGQLYQVETTEDFSMWTAFGGQRFAPGTSDSVSVPVGNSLGYYRVNRIR